MKKLFIFIVLSLSLYQAHSQIDLNFELQVYPTGIIPGIRIEQNQGEMSATHLRIGYNWIRHRDLGVQEDERGDGFGFTIGHKRYFKNNHQGWNIGLKTDFWRNTLDWKNNINQVDEITGTTKITVIQPTAELGYLIQKENFHLTPTIAFGYEWNVKTEGEPTGEGAILLLGIQLGKRF